MLVRGRQWIRWAAIDGFIVVPKAPCWADDDACFFGFLSCDSHLIKPPTNREGVQRFQLTHILDNPRCGRGSLPEPTARYQANGSIPCPIPQHTIVQCFLSCTTDGRFSKSGETSNLSTANTIPHSVLFSASASRLPYGSLQGKQN